MKRLQKISHIAAALVALLASVPALAEEAVATATTASTATGSLGLIAIGVGITMGLAVLGGTLGQSRAAAAALDGTARNPGAQGKLFVQLILSLALMESLVIFAFAISFLLTNSVTGLLK